MRIQLKLLLLLVSMPVLCLAFYLLLVIDLFEKDKIAYVFDSSSSVSKIMAIQVDSKLKGTVERLRPIVKGFNPRAKAFNAESLRLFHSNKDFLDLVIYDSNKKILAKIGKSNMFVFINGNGMRIRLEDRAKGIISLAFPVQNYRVQIRYRALDLMAIFQKDSVYHNAMISSSGQLILGSEDLKNRKISKWDFVKGLKLNKRNSGVLESNSPDGEAWLVSYSKLGVGNIYSVSLVQKSKAMMAVLLLYRKSILFFISLISAAIMISMLVSKAATSSLKDLAVAASKVGRGDFKVEVEAKSKDEIGELANGFNHMANEISDLMVKNIEKTRMEQELKTAQAVQEQLFPDVKFKNDFLNLSGFYQSSSECGGDWWYVNEVGDDIYLWIADATGHGAGAALVTSAAKAVSTIVSQLGDVTPDKALNYMNRAIHEATKGKICMTMFVGAYNKRKGTFTYSNSGHESPLMVFPGQNSYVRDDFSPLVEANGLRLGDQPDSEYSSHTIKIEKGTKIFFYTDGVIDIENPEGKTWSERKAMKQLLESINGGDDVFGTVAYLESQIESFRKGTGLKDDVTYFMVEFLKNPLLQEAPPPLCVNSGIDIPPLPPLPPKDSEG